MSFRNTARAVLKPALPLLRGARRSCLAMAYKLRRNSVPSVINRPIPFSLSAPIEADFLIGTLSGLMYFYRGKLYRLFSGRVYGITTHDGRWYVYRNQELAFGKGWGPEKGQILSFRLEGLEVKHLRAEASLLDPEIHQLDVFQNRLYATDTANNCLIVYEITAKGLRKPRFHYPNGPLPADGLKSNYVHLNSVFHDGDHLYLVYHNQTYKTGRMSEVVQLDQDFRVKKRWETQGKSAHNIYVDPYGYLICNSQDGELYYNDHLLVRVPYYTRGLALNNDRVLLGASEFANKAQRAGKDGHILALDRDNFQPLSHLSIPRSGSIYEVRLVNQPDYGLSDMAVAQREERLPLSSLI